MDYRCEHAHFTVIFLHFWIICHAIILSFSNQAYDKIEFVTEVLLDSMAKIPCDLTPSEEADLVALVIWYKDLSKTPIYSLDVRERELHQGLHWSDGRLEGRAYFTAVHPHSVLTLYNVKESDAGVYRCRVDFKRSPTRNYLVNLTVVVPTRKLVLLDSSHKIINQSVLGPIQEGMPLQITCVAVGGKPSPRVTWWLNGVLVDSSNDAEHEDRVHNVLVLQRVLRSHMAATLLCQANNTALLIPLSAAVTIDMYLTPVEVHLLGENLALSAGSKYEMACQSSGSRPPATITWWKSGIMLKENVRKVLEWIHYLTHSKKITWESIRLQRCALSTGTVITLQNAEAPATEMKYISEDGNVTTSTITLTVNTEDSGHVLSCKATNHHIPNATLVDSWVLDVYYAPTAVIKLGRYMNSSQIKEGMNVSLQCEINANPPSNIVTWIYEPQGSSKKQLIMGNETLILPAITRHSGGFYSCMVSNSEGKAQSNKYLVDVKYIPHCKGNQRESYGTARFEEINVICELESNPPVENFYWIFNSSSGVTTREMKNVITSDFSSVVTYSPRLESDYGELFCWGSNELGSQIVPCVFHIIPSGNPEAPFNCSYSYRSETWVHLKCKTSLDGGKFVAEVRSDGRLVANVSNMGSPVFTLTSLEPGVSYSVAVYSSNNKGRSESVQVEFHTLGSPLIQHRRNEITVQSAVTTIVWVASGIVISFMLIVIIVVLTVMTVRKCQELTPGNSNFHLDKTMQLSTIQVSLNSGDDDRNPDVIPHSVVEGVSLTSVPELDTGVIVCQKVPLTTDKTLTSQSDQSTCQWTNVLDSYDAETTPLKQNVETQTADLHLESVV